MKKSRFSRAGKYRFLKAYIGTLGAYKIGEVYFLDKETASAFLKNNEVEPIKKSSIFFKKIKKREPKK